jgi:hypothetical protein
VDADVCGRLSCDTTDQRYSIAPSTPYARSARTIFPLCTRTEYSSCLSRTRTSQTPISRFHVGAAVVSVQVDHSG